MALTNCASDSYDSFVPAVEGIEGREDDSQLRQFQRLFTVRYRHKRRHK